MIKWARTRNARHSWARLTVALAAVFAGTAFAQPGPNSSVVVTVESGQVRGIAAGGVISFKGIPYAMSPVGELRWRPPQPARPWRTLRDAAQFGPNCMQDHDVPQSEDCLTLNIWRPSAASESHLPVMVWIHGGGLVHGSASLLPADALAKQGIVVVSMNYRLGRLGFFAHPALAAEAPNELRGNYGYMDQRAALQWIQRNIAEFGGNPKAVTIFGGSAGAGSVLVHLTSSLSRGLFQRAILQSPAIPSSRAKVLPLTELADAEKRAVDYARSLGVSAEGPEALKQLRAIAGHKLVKGSSGPAIIAALSTNRRILGAAGPIRDGNFVVETPDTVLAAKRQAMIPVLIGANDRDLALGQASSKDELFAVFGAYSDEAQKLYDPAGNMELEELKQQVFADKTIVEPARHLADQMALAGQPVWLYRFSYVPESRRRPRRGARHGAEIPYIFKFAPRAASDRSANSNETALADLISAYWVSFAKTGDPNGRGRPAWSPHEAGVDRLFNFTNAGPVVGPDPLRARLDLWMKVWSSVH